MDTVYLTALRIDGREIVLPFLIAHIHCPFVGEQHRITSIAGGHHTVEHIHATLDGFEDVLRRTDSHQITGTVLGQDLIHHLDHLIHHLRRLTHSQTTNRGASTVVQLCQHITHMLGSILAQILISTALYDGEQCLVIAIDRFSLVETFHASFQPALCQPQTLFGILVVALSWRTFVERHHDVGANHSLGIHHVFWRKYMPGTIDMTLELATFLTQLADACQREYLKAARVCQYRTVPGVELMQSASLSEDMKSRSQIQMIGIAENDLSLHLFPQFGEMHTLHTAHRTDGHKDGRLYLSVRGLYHSSPRVTIRICMFYFKRHLSNTTILSIYDNIDNQDNSYGL